MADLILDYNIVNTHSSFRNFPDFCPHCHKAFSPELQFSKTTERYDEGKSWLSIELLISCPDFNCRKASLLYFENFNPRSNGSSYHFIEIAKGTPLKINIPQTILDTSPSFGSIYNEAHHAEHENLLQICGVGYRKALEFLIKDYLIQKDPGSEDKIKVKFLGRCIKDHIDNPKIKQAAERAAWLGNDETHYTRKWLNKDLHDLKLLIRLTLHWIEMEVLSDQLEVDMPK